MRGEWIEIYAMCKEEDPRICLSPCGESGLKCRGVQVVDHAVCLSPCGESGLKCDLKKMIGGNEKSLPMRGEWIEIYDDVMGYVALRAVSPHAGRVD